MVKGLHYKKSSYSTDQEVVPTIDSFKQWEKEEIALNIQYTIMYKQEKVIMTYNTMRKLQMMQEE